MGYRLYDPAPTFVNLLGTASAAVGSLTFYDKGTTTPKNTYSDEALTIPNTNPVLLDSDGRAATEIWLDGSYTVVLKDEDATTVWTRDVVPEVTTGSSLPSQTGQADKFLTTDGTNAAWTTIRQLPDPTGSGGEMVVALPDGSGYTTQPIPEPPDPEVVVAVNSVQVGISTNTSKYLLQDGSSSAPSSGAHTTQVAVVFPTAFSTVPKVLIEPTVSAVSSGGFLVAHSVIAKSETGFTVKFDTNEDSGTLGNIINPVTFDWVAHGRITVAA